jgi:CheY-like chemotaxis protein
MPGMDGFTLAGKIRNRPDFAGVFIMMFTSAGYKGDSTRCAELGVSAYLVKPIRQSELLAAICMVLSKTPLENTLPLVTRQVLRENQRGLKVLLAEDNAVNQLLVLRLLEKRGHRVSAVRDGRAAFAAFGAEPFDVVLMDIQMPEMDGFQATALIREREKESGTHVPVIALTAHAMKGDRERCLAAGMDGYLTKPIRSNELDEVLNTIVTARMEPAVPAVKSET